MKLLSISLIAIAMPQISVAQAGTAPVSNSLLARHYQEGEKLTCHMTGTNRGHQQTTVYQVDATGVVKKDSSGKFIEEYAWSNLVMNGKPVALSPAATNFRQQLSLDTFTGIPDLSQVIPLIGPITDMLTLYSDLLLATRQGTLAKAGDHFYFAHGTPNSWADGNYVILGQDSIDFDITLAEVNRSDQTATVVVRHVPPAQPQTKIPAEWMRAPVADTPNNWIEVENRGDGKYAAEVGKETFESRIKISLVNGKILSATIDNPVEVLERDCSDAALSSCGDPMRYQIRRQIEIH